MVVVKDAHGSQGFTDSPAKDVIEHFNRAWERAGGHPMKEKDVTFEVLDSSQNSAR